MEIGELEKTAAQYSDIIYRVALQYTAHPCDAEDVLQEVLMELFRKSEVFESPDHERRWLLRVTINKSKNLLRRGKRHHTLSIEELPETAAPPETSYRELYEAVLSLPRNQRLTVDLYYYEGYTTEEIAALMDARPATVRTWLRRAKLTLKKRLKEDWDDD